MLPSALPQVHIFIINNNGSPFVFECVASVLQTKYPNFNVIFFDNGSTDGSYDFVKDIGKKHDNLLIIRARRALGVARATNFMISIASHRAKYIALLDNDVMVDRDWLAELAKPLEMNRKVVCAQSLLLRKSPPRTIDGTGDFIDVLINAVSRHANRELKSIDLHSSSEEIFSARSAAMIVRNDLYEVVGGLDETMGIGLEDVDLGWRLNLAGGAIQLAPKSLVYHRVGSSTSRLPLSYWTYLGTRNRILMLLKNYEIGNALKYFLIRFAFDALRAVALVTIGHPGLSLAILKGLWWNIRNIRTVWQKHTFVQTRIRKVPDSSLIGKRISRRLFIDLASSRRLLQSERYRLDQAQTGRSWRLHSDAPKG